ncbi:MAG: DUF411 domain-containing protein [Candidatus Competibacteraceae bacterium]|nr:DUF411 domain-containing protein [Candidatus Competibacteraceae bacterium]
MPYTQALGFAEKKPPLLMGHKAMKQKILYLSIFLLLAFTGLLIWNPPWIQKNPGLATAAQAVTVYRSPTCGCCENYADYLEGKGFKVDLIETNDLDRIKAKYGIPSHFKSCHTTVMGDYVVEGHIPVEVVHKLLDEKPAVAGIAMPGMPSGSPGMPGAKREKFRVYSFDAKGNQLDVFAEM